MCHGSIRKVNTASYSLNEYEIEFKRGVEGQSTLTHRKEGRNS